MGCRFITGFVAALFGFAGSAQEAPRGSSALIAPTFSEHIAPLLYEHCLACHRAGEAAPFQLLEYAEVAKRARQIATVTTSRYMPPWLPTPDSGPFVGDRRLSDEEIATLARWAETGAPEGDPERLPEPPKVVEGWQLGEPDLVLSMPEPYLVPEEGLDLWRNFVIPVPLERARFVEALELRPGNKRVVHHAVIRADRTASSRELDARDAEPGFAGMEMALSESPDGQFLGWTPGRVPQRGAEGTAWTLKPGMDLVVQLHLVPTGKPEPVQVALGLFFTDRPPSKRAMVLRLRDDALLIPPGEPAYVVEDSLVLPIPLRVTKIYPHAHYLGKRIEAFGLLPDGSRRDLLRIEDWDFNWQDEFLFVEPVSLPKGTRLAMRFTYDNSAENPRNPQVPPQLVRFGNRSLDEMATLTLQVETEGPEARAALMESATRHRVEKHPDFWVARLNLGAVLAEQGRFEEAAEHLRAGLALEPHSVELHMNLGGVLASLDRAQEALAEFQEALRLSPGNPNVHANLAQLAALRGRWAEVVEHDRAVLASNPRDVRALQGLSAALIRLERLDEAREALERALAVDSRDPESHLQLGRILARQGRLAEAATSLRASLELRASAEAHAELARVYEASGLAAEAAEQRAAAKRLAGPGRR
jgi:tetratricopeptide (TPR) repeat protein